MPNIPTLPDTVDALIESDRVLDLAVRSLKDPSLKAKVRSDVASLHFPETRDRGEEELERGVRLTIVGMARWDPAFEPVQEPADQRRFEEVAKAWLIWSNGMRAEVPDETKSMAAGGGMNLMAYNLWAVAVQALINGELAEAERYYRRLLELGAQYDIEHFRMIKWTYAASFFHSGLTSEG